MAALRISIGYSFFMDNVLCGASVTAQDRHVKTGLIFDLDGTLVDSLPGIAASLNHALALCGAATHTEGAVRGFIGNGSWVLAKRALPAGSADEVIAAVESAFKEHYDQHWMEGTKPYQAIPEMLGELQRRGHPLAVLSNKPHPFTTVIVGHLFPEVKFDVVVGQRPGIPHKPDPTGALEIVERFGLPREDCVLVGDSTVDLETAANAGIGSIAVSWGYHDRDRLGAAGGRIVDGVEDLLIALG